MAGNLRFSNPKTLAKPPGYSYVVEATGPNRLIYLAGQLGLDMNSQFVGAPGDFRAQCMQAFDNMTLALTAAGTKCFWLQNSGTSADSGVNLSA